MPCPKTILSGNTVLMSSPRLADMRGLTPLTETTAAADPHVAYRLLREVWGEVAPVELEPGINAWLVMGYTELVQVLRNERLFAKSSEHWREYAEGRVQPNSRLGPLMCPRPNAWMADGAEHQRFRAPVVAAVEGLHLRQASGQVKEICFSLIDAFAGRGQADLVLEYALMIPALVIGRLLGLDLETAQVLHQTLLQIFALNDGTQAANDRVEAILLDLVLARLDEPTDDMASVIVHHESMRDTTEMVFTLLLLIAASSECTMAWIAGTLQMLLTDPRFSGRLLGGRLIVEDALDEVLWRDPPVANLPGRYARADTVLGTQFVEKGDALILGYGAAAIDPRVHSDDHWDEVGNRSYLAWSTGPHMCPAQTPARLIVRDAVEAVLYRLPALKLAVPASGITRLPSPWGRCPGSLPVTFTPVSSGHTAKPEAMRARG